MERITDVLNGRGRFQSWITSQTHMKQLRLKAPWRRKATTGTIPGDINYPPGIPDMSLVPYCIHSYCLTRGPLYLFPISGQGLP